jgi:hypothetical protein
MGALPSSRAATGARHQCGVPPTRPLVLLNRLVGACQQRSRSREAPCPVAILTMSSSLIGKLRGASSEVGNSGAVTEFRV